jgi:predicted ATPase
MMHQLAERALALDPSNLQALSALNHSRRILRGLYTPPTTITPARVRDTPSLITVAPLGGHAAEQDTILAGRTTDVTVLTNAFSRARRGCGNTITLEAPPGAGKSRLLRELTHIARYDEATIVRTTTPLAYSAPPLSTCYDLIIKLLRTPGASGCDPHTTTILEEFTKNPTTYTSELPTLIAATSDLLSAIAYEQPLVLIMEDVHHLDAPSQTLFHNIITRITHDPIFCIITQRPHVTKDAPPTTNQAAPSQAAPCQAAPNQVTPTSHTHHRLPPLDPTAATRHFEAYRAGIAHRMPEELRAWCIHIANGNPYFAEELINLWTDTPHDPITETPPTSLTTLLNTRLHRLPSLSYRILQSCAILGPHATLPRIARLANASEWRVAAITAELRTNGFMTVANTAITPSQHRLRCRHPLLAEHALALLSQDDRRTLHDQAATNLKRDLPTSTKALAIAYEAHKAAAEANPPKHPVESL